MSYELVTHGSFYVEIYLFPAPYIKQSVVDSYGKLAAAQNSIFNKLFACCTPALANEVGQEIGYSEAELKAVPEGANLGVGCGNPSALANLKPGDTVVDLGSGAGFDCFLVAQQVGENGQVIGVDLSEEMLTLANKNAKKGNYQNVQFVKGDIESMPLESNIADGIISNCVINLSLNKGDVFKEAYRVLKPGGRLAISDVVLESELPDFVKNSLAGHVACVAGAEKLDAYLGYVNAAGFKAVKVESKKTFPLELMLADPMVQKIAKQMDFDLSSDEAKDIAARVSSITLSAVK